MRVLLMVIAVVCFTSHAHALELKNITAGQENNTAYLKFDIANMPGERFADVVVEIEIDGNKIDSASLTLAGDVGSSIPVGKNKKIVWKILKDMPAGFEGEIVWYVDVKQDKKKDDPFNLMSGKKSTVVKVNDKIVHDKSSGLMWPRNLEFGAPSDLNEARAIVEQLNSNSYAGYNDWKIPTNADLGKLATVLSSNYGYSKGKTMLYALEKVGFSNVHDGYFWSMDMIQAETFDVDTNVQRYKAKVDVSANSSYNSSSSRSASGNYGNSGNYSNAGTGNYSRSAGGNTSISQRGDASATAKVYVAKVETNGVEMSNAVMNLNDGYIYRKQMVTNSAILLPVRYETSKRMVKTSIKITSSDK